MKDRFSPARIGDWVMNCQICKKKLYASESFLLDTYTGKGGLRVCSDCNDPIDYGLVPYKIPAEQPIPFSFDATFAGNPNPPYPEPYKPFDIRLFDPTTPPGVANIIYLTWDQLDQVTWGNWILPWNMTSS